jgi:diketogulonate reductase-like aldo/keto reductase
MSNEPGPGTCFINDKDVVQAVKDVAEIGYRHIDTAQACGNENGVGEGIRACGVKETKCL